MRFNRLAALALLGLFMPALFAAQGTTQLPTSGTYTGAQMVNYINAAHTAMTTMQSGSSDPGTNGGPYSFWADTGTSYLRQRNGANSAWVSIYPLLTPLAPLASPALTGTPTAPTASTGTSNTQIATTNYVVNRVANDAPTKTGGGASGTWAINVTGAAGSASSAAYATSSGNADTVDGLHASAFLQSSQITVSGNSTAWEFVIGPIHIKGGHVTSTHDGDEVFNFASAFPNACLSVMTTPSSINAAYVYSVTAITAASFTVNRTDATDGSGTYRYIAVGY